MNNLCIVCLRAILAYQAKKSVLLLLLMVIEGQFRPARGSAVRAKLQGEVACCNLGRELTFILPSL